MALKNVNVADSGGSSGTKTTKKPTNVSTPNSVDQTGTGRPVTTNNSSSGKSSTSTSSYVPDSVRIAQQKGEATAAFLEEQEKKRQSGGTTGGGGGGGSSKSTSSSAKVDTKEDTSTDYTQAANTVSRIIQGVDMSDKIAEANDAWDQATQNYEQQSGQIIGNYETDTNAGLEEYRGNAQAIIDQLSNITGQELADYADSTGQTIQQATEQINSILQGLQANLQPVNAGRVGRVDTTEQQNILEQMTANQREQAANQINYAVQQGVNELQRAEEDAQPQFQTQRNQIAAEERNALDNKALYSEMRGDRGGVGQAQYDSIRNAAATNQLKVNQAQTKLATDTARQIADLRAQGEFDIADKYLEISQEYLGKLMQLKQWADEMNVSIDEFNIGVDQWEEEYNAKLQETLGELGINATQYTTGLNLDQQQYLTSQGLNAANTEANLNLNLQGDVQKQRQALNDALAQYGLSNAQYMTNQDISRLTSILSAYQQNAQNVASTELTAANVFGAASDATPTFAAYQADIERQAKVAQQMIAMGITPTDDQLKALGWTKSEYKAYKAALEAAAAAAARGGGGGGMTLYKQMQTMIQGGIVLGDMKQYLQNQIASGAYASGDVSRSQQLVGGLNSNNYQGYKPLT